MDAADIDNLQKETQVTLPICYTELLLKQPEWLSRMRRGSEKEGEPITRYDVVTDAGALLDLIRHVGNPETADWLPSGEEWPNYLFVIGENGGGDYYLIDTRDPKAPVIRFNHEIGALEPHAKSLEDYLDMVYAAVEEFNFWYSDDSPLAHAQSGEEKLRLFKEFSARKKARAPRRDT